MNTLITAARAALVQLEHLHGTRHCQNPEHCPTHQAIIEITRALRETAIGREESTTLRPGVTVTVPPEGSVPNCCTCDYACFPLKHDPRCPIHGIFFNPAETAGAIIANAGHEPPRMVNPPGDVLPPAATPTVEYQTQPDFQAFDGIKVEPTLDAMRAAVEMETGVRFVPTGEPTKAPHEFVVSPRNPESDCCVCGLPKDQHPPICEWSDCGRPATQKYVTATGATHWCNRHALDLNTWGTDGKWRPINPDDSPDMKDFASGIPTITGGDTVAEGIANGTKFMPAPARRLCLRCDALLPDGTPLNVNVCPNCDHL